MLRKVMMGLGMMSMVAMAGADTLDVGLSDTTAHFKYGVPSSVTGRSELYAELMYNDIGSVLGGVGLLVANDEAKAPGLTIGAGAKAVSAFIKTGTITRYNASAVALGLQMRYEFPSERRFAVAGDIYVAPKIITYGDAERYQQVGARLEFSLSPQMQIYAGYRRMVFNIKNTVVDAVLVDGTHLGLQLSF